MEITSVAYLIFVFVSLIIYWRTPAGRQWWILLADSAVFYFVNAKPYTVIYLLISVASVYAATIFFAQTQNEKKRKIVLVITIVVNIGILAVLKYTNLLISTVNYVGKKNISLVSWPSSLAISFYTLQIVAYLLDCYWGVAETEKNPLKLLLFTGYFPLMISGPISMHQQLSHQLFEEHRFEYDRVTSGLRRIAWGIAKKVVVADRLAVVVNYMFYSPDMFSGIWVLAAAIAFVIELYFDFSGCMDIIIGVSRCFGIELTENFKAPFLSRTVQEFWQRWHITLGAWLKSYVMYPLLKSSYFVGLSAKCKKKFGKQGKKIPSYIAMLAVWLLVGLWHGNSWKYIIGEGLWFWIVIVLGQISEPLFIKIRKALHISAGNTIWEGFRICRTIILYSLGMIFFKASSLSAAFYMIGRLFSKTAILEPLQSLYSGTWAAFGGKYALLAVVIMGSAQIFADVKTYKGESAQQCIMKLPFVFRWILYAAFVYLIILMGVFGKSSFIYFGF